MTVAIYGKCDPKFQHVADEFEKNFRERDEVGASVCVKVEGETVVDLWGGTADVETQKPWEEDTVSIVMSCTKAATALCAHILASRGKLDLDAPVAQYWPEFAQAGKEKITVKQLLNHQAGLSVIREPLEKGAYRDWDRIVHILEKQEPLWEPGTKHGYHSITFGWLVGEVIRRVSGKPLGQFFQEEVAKPLGIDFWIGLPEEIEPRVATMMVSPPRNLDTPYVRAIMQLGTLQNMALNTGGIMEELNTRNLNAAEVGASNGITNARGLAGMYAPLANGGSLGDVTLVDSDTLARMSAVSSATGQDANLMIPTRFSLGYMKSIDNRKNTLGLRDSIIMSEDAFGHAGRGGSIGFASPDNKMAFGYTMNLMGNTITLNDRGQSLIDATYKSLGFTSNLSGNWIK